MKKKIVVLLSLIVIITVLAIFSKNKLKKNKIEYTISNIEVYKFIKYKDKGNFGIIDRDGNIIVEASYKDIEIPNPEKDLFICYKDEEETEVLNSKKEKLFTQYDKIEAIKIKI